MKKTDAATTTTTSESLPNEGGRYEYRNGERVRVEEPTEHKRAEPVRNAGERGKQPEADKPAA